MLSRIWSEKYTQNNVAGLYNYCISLCFTTSVAIFVILLTLHHVYRVITDSSGSASKVKPPQGTLKSSTSGAAGVGPR